MADMVTIIKRDQHANGLGKSEHYNEREAARVIEDHFVAHPDGYVELVFPERTRYAFYREQGTRILSAEWTG